jgi:Tol biopolymer transport system component
MGGIHATIYVADLDADGARIGNPTHFTLTESRDLLADWTQDSKAMIFLSNRTGRAGIYKQFLNSDTPELIVTEPGGMANPHVTPDGKWVVYVLDTRARGALGSLQLVRVPIMGGASQRIFPVRAGSLPLCTRAPYNACAIAEPNQDATQIIVTAFDPASGRGPELTRIDVDPAVNCTFDLSPDGSHIAALTNPAGPLRIVSLRGQHLRVIRPTGLENLQSVHWAANGRGLYVSTGMRSRTALWHLDLQGNSNLLWENRGGQLASGLPSPDGRHMAIQNSDKAANVWMMEDF